MSSTCNSCHGRILRHSPGLVCKTFDCYYHVWCVPGMSRDDSVNFIQGISQWLCMFCMYVNLPFIHLDNDEYSDVINENFISAVPQMLSDLDNLVFDPFDISGESENLNICDNDPDLHFFNDLRHVFNCAYYTEDGFNKKCTNMGTDVNSEL